MKTATWMSAVGRVTPCAPFQTAECECGARGVTRPTGPNCSCVFTPTNIAALSTALLITSWICRLAVAAILVQTLYFKFTGAEESIYIFTRVGLEPWGRYVSGVAELFAAILLIFPRTTWFGALIAVGVMLGAIGSHLTKLGIVVKNDSGLLFTLALIVFVCALATLCIHRRQIPVIGNLLPK